MMLGVNNVEFVMSCITGKLSHLHSACKPSPQLVEDTITQPAVETFPIPCFRLSFACWSTFLLRGSLPKVERRIFQIFEALTRTQHQHESTSRFSRQRLKIYIMKPLLGSAGMMMRRRSSISALLSSGEYDAQDTCIHIAQSRSTARLCFSAVCSIKFVPYTSVYLTY